jgi:hypothetical protein
MHVALRLQADAADHLVGRRDREIGGFLPGDRRIEEGAGVRRGVRMREAVAQRDPHGAVVRMAHQRAGIGAREAAHEVAVAEIERQLAEGRCAPRHRLRRYYAAREGSSRRASDGTGRGRPVPRRPPLVRAGRVWQRPTVEREIIVASPRGFCAGVSHAIEIVDLVLERQGPPVYVRHEIVHNRHVVDNLRARGAIFVEELADVPPGSLVVFSAHGVAPSVRA